MITWMQRHKKWLVVTIWISVIAFVGAGFVGWGDYDFNMNRSSSVAKVADEKISIMELNQRYSQVFSYYNEISNGTLTEQRAKESGLDSLALQSLIEDKLLISFAKRLGLSVSEDEILRVLINDKQFLDTNGLFDKNIYYAILAQNDIKPTQYESIIYDEILLDKLSLLFAMPLKQEELEIIVGAARRFEEGSCREQLFLSSLLGIYPTDMLFKSPDGEAEVVKKGDSLYAVSGYRKLLDAAHRGLRAVEVKYLGAEGSVLPDGTKAENAANTSPELISEWEHAAGLKYGYVPN